MVNLSEYMAEEKPINRWTIFKVAMIGAFCGAALTTVFLLGAVTIQ